MYSSSYARHTILCQWSIVGCKEKKELLFGDGYGSKRYRFSVGLDFNYKAGDKAIDNLTYCL